MLPQLIPVAAIGGLWLLGRHELLQRLRALNERVEFAKRFGEDLQTYVRSKGRDEEIYASLVQRSLTLQRYLGPLGLVTYRPPFANFAHTNFPAIVNLLPEIHGEFRDHPFGGGPSLEVRIQLLFDMLNRHAGAQAELLEMAEQDASNVIKQLVTGVRAVIWWPFWLLTELGILPKTVSERLRRSAGLRLVEGVLTLFGAVASLIGLVAEWETVVAVGRWIRDLFVP